MLKSDEAINTNYPIRKKRFLYLLLENNRPIPAAGGAIACYTKTRTFPKWPRFSETDNNRGIFLLYDKQLFD